MITRRTTHCSSGAGFQSLTLRRDFMCFIGDGGGESGLGAVVNGLAGDASFDAID